MTERFSGIFARTGTWPVRAFLWKTHNEHEAPRVREDTGRRVSYERLAAGRGIAAAVIVAATVVAAPAARTTAIAAAAPNDDQQDDDPAAVATAKTVIAHTGTSYEFVDRPNRSQSIVCCPGKEVPLFLELEISAAAASDWAAEKTPLLIRVSRRVRPVPDTSASRE